MPRRAPTRSASPAASRASTLAARRPRWEGAWTITRADTRTSYRDDRNGGQVCAQEALDRQLPLQPGRPNGQVIATSLATVLQAALIPVASSVGTDVKPAVRAPLDMMVHWDRW